MDSKNTETKCREDLRFLLPPRITTETEERPQQQYNISQMCTHKYGNKEYAFTRDFASSPTPSIQERVRSDQTP